MLIVDVCNVDTLCMSSAVPVIPAFVPTVHIHTINVTVFKALSYNKLAQIVCMLQYTPGTVTPGPVYIKRNRRWHT